MAYVAEFLAARGPGAHHIMLSAASYAKSRNHVTGGDSPLLLKGQLHGTRFCLFDTNEDLGTIVEFAESDDPPMGG